MTYILIGAMIGYFIGEATLTWQEWKKSLRFSWPHPEQFWKEFAQNVDMHWNLHMFREEEVNAGRLASWKIKYRLSMGDPWHGR